MTGYRSFERREGDGGDAVTLEGLGELVTLQEAARATRLSERTIRSAIKRDELEAFIPGGRDPRKPGRGMGYRIKRSDLQRWFFGAARGTAT